MCKPPLPPLQPHTVRFVRSDGQEETQTFHTAGPNDALMLMLGTSRMRQRGYAVAVYVDGQFVEEFPVVGTPDPELPALKALT